MPRYIEADKLKARMFNYYGCVNADTSKSNYRGETLMNYEVADMIEDCIDNAPTADVVEVVRCGDCIYFKESEKPHNYYCEWCGKHLDVYGCDYCSRGIRRG